MEFRCVALEDDESGEESNEDGEALEENDGAPSEGEPGTTDEINGNRKGELPFGTPMVVGSLSASSSTEELGKSFGGMSISPMFL